MNIAVFVRGDFALFVGHAPDETLAPVGNADTSPDPNVTVH